jgi:hypothetical protein
MSRKYGSLSIVTVAFVVTHLSSASVLARVYEPVPLPDGGSMGLLGIAALLALGAAKRMLRGKR